MQVKNEILNMLYLSKINFIDAYDCVVNGNTENIEKIEKREEDIDYINNEIAKYLISLSSNSDPALEKKIGSYFHVINDIERIGDHAINMLKVASEMKNDDIIFSSNANDDLNLIYNNVMEMFDVSKNVFEESDTSKLKYLGELEAKTDNMKKEMSAKHFVRLMKDSCKLELTAYYTTLISNIERVGDHLVNIGYSIINPTGTQNE